MLSLAKELKDGVFLGTDISPEAISLAQENAAMCGLEEKVHFAVADGMDEFDPEAVDPDDVEMLQDMVIAAVNEAIRAAMDDMSSTMSQLTSGLNLPF